MVAAEARMEQPIDGIGTSDQARPLAGRTRHVGDESQTPDLKTVRARSVHVSEQLERPPVGGPQTRGRQVLWCNVPFASVMQPGQWTTRMRHRGRDPPQVPHQVVLIAVQPLCQRARRVRSRAAARGTLTEPGQFGKDGAFQAWIDAHADRRWDVFTRRQRLRWSIAITDATDDRS